MHSMQTLETHLDLSLLPLITAGKSVTSLNAEKSPAVPFLPYPENCRGYVGEETGFDPVGFSNYFPMDYLREAELKHCRMAMLAIVGFVVVDLGARVQPLPESWQGLTAATAHDKMVEYGALGNIALFVCILEMVSYIGVSQMLQGSGREPGNFGFDPLGFLKDKSEEEIKTMKMKELSNGRLAMMAFGGAVTQSVLYDSGFPYTST
jgi:light-harvesting complex I chlorophyll a/b binding protein 1